MNVYRIRSGERWYNASTEDLSPMFTNCKRAEKAIRDGVRIAKHRVDEWGAKPKSWWVDDLSFWSAAEIVTYKLVRQ